jgi:hypothetical protein
MRSGAPVGGTSVLMWMISYLDVLRLTDEQLLELRVAHDLCVMLENTGDLLLLCG